MRTYLNVSEHNLEDSCRHFSTAGISINAHLHGHFSHFQKNHGTRESGTTVEGILSECISLIVSLMHTVRTSGVYSFFKMDKVTYL